MGGWAARCTAVSELAATWQGWAANEWPVGQWFQLTFQTPAFYTGPPDDPSSTKIRPADAYIDPQAARQIVDVRFATTRGVDAFVSVAFEVERLHAGSGPRRVWTNVEKLNGFMQWPLALGVPRRGHVIWARRLTTTDAGKGKGGDKGKGQGGGKGKGHRDGPY